MQMSRIALVMLLILGESTVRECAGQDVVEAIRELKSWQEKIVSIRFQSQAITLGEENLMEKEAGVRIGKREADYVWDDSSRYLARDIVYNDGRVVGRSWSSADLKHGFHAGYTADPATDIPVSVNIYDTSLSKSEKSAGHTLPLVALLDDGTRTWLGDRLITAGDAAQAKLKDRKSVV